MTSPTNKELMQTHLNRVRAYIEQGGDFATWHEQLMQPLALYLSLWANDVPESSLSNDGVPGAVDPNETYEAGIFSLPTPGQGEAFYARMDASSIDFMDDVSGNGRDPSNKGSINPSNVQREHAILKKYNRIFNNVFFNWNAGTGLPAALAGDHVIFDMIHMGVKDFANDVPLFAIEDGTTQLMRMAMWGDGVQIFANNGWRDTTLNIKQFSGHNVPMIALTYQRMEDPSNSSNWLHRMYENGLLYFEYSGAKTAGTPDNVVIGGRSTLHFFRIRTETTDNPAAWHYKAIPYA